MDMTKIGANALFACSFLLLVIPVSAQQVAPKAKVDEQCCKANNAECESFCRSPEGAKQGQLCWNTCGARIKKCL